MAKKVKFNELSAEELAGKIKEMEKKIVTLRMKKNQRALKDTTEIPKVKKDIARAKTFLNMKRTVKNG
ncbi:MAG: 50S ribosomal protein L29 [Planctomycetota bacterium]